MDPNTVVTTALAVGGAAVRKPTVEMAVKNAYTDLKSLILERFGEKGAVAKAIAKVEDNPMDARKAILAEELRGAGADADQEVVERAVGLLKLLESKSRGVTAQIGSASSKAGVTQTSRRGVKL